MYLTRLFIHNIRAIQSLEWEVPLRKAPGWHVILGDNGSGKSSVLRSIALALVGPYEAMALRQDWGLWLRGEEQAVVRLELVPDPKTDRQVGGRTRKVVVAVGFTFDETSEKVTPFSAFNKGEVDEYVWAGRSGWFSASYGPFRRFTGGDEDYDKLFGTYPRLARHLSVFDESVALTEGLKWLQRLQFKKLEKDPGNRSPVGACLRGLPGSGRWAGRRSTVVAAT